MYDSKHRSQSRYTRTERSSGSGEASGVEDGAWAWREDGSPKPKRIKRGRRSGGLGNGPRQPMDTGQGEDDEGPGRKGGGGLVIRGRPPSIFCLSLAHGFDSAGDPRPAESVSFFPGHSFGGKVKTEVNTFYVGHIFRLSPRKNRYGGRLRVPAGDVKVWRKSPRIQRRAAEGLGLLTAISYVLFALHLSLKTKDSGGAACSGESRAVPDCSLSNDSLVCRNSFPRRPTRCPFFP